MPSVDLILEHTLKLTTPELRLVLQALGGRLKPEDVDKAKQLGDQLTAMRAKRTLHALQEVDKLMKNIGETDE